MAKERVFRNPESVEAEQLSRDAVKPFLESRGFVVELDQRIVRGVAQAQIVTARSVAGQRIRMRVRLCWRTDRPTGFLYSAAQLRADLVDNDWDKTLVQLVERDVENGISHALIFQRAGDTVALAALVPIEQLGAIWHRQAEVSDMLIQSGRMGRVKKNQAKNGNSPTLWLMDIRSEHSHMVPDVLWNWPGVQDLVKTPALRIHADGPVDDTLDDISGPDYSTFGSDGAARVPIVRSNVKRDPRVRREVIRRSEGRCERSSCAIKARYKGFLDVHHILRAENSDRIWNCVALCPNCHRDAHFALNREEIDADLLKFAEQFRS